LVEEEATIRDVTQQGVKSKENDMQEFDADIKPEFVKSGPLKKKLSIYGRRGDRNPTPDDEEDIYWINDYWFAPSWFDIEFIGNNEKWGDDFVEGEMGALKRYLLQTAILKQVIDVAPLSIYVCIENLQRYYKNKIKELEDKCLKMPTTNGTQESTTETP